MDIYDLQPVGPTPAAATKGERSRARIVDAAFRLFVEQGFHGASMRQIARHADLALAGIYNHFASKEDLFVAVLDRHNPYAEIVPALRSARGAAAEDLVRDAAERMLAVFERRPDSLHLMFVEVVEFGGRHLQQLFRNTFPQMMGFAQLLTQSRGTLRPIPLPTVVRALLGLFFAYLMTGWLIGEQFPAELQREAFDDFVDIYLHGILASPP